VSPDLGRRLERLEASRARALSIVAAFPAELEGRLVFRHPFAGRMGLADTLAFLRRTSTTTCPRSSGR